jgi:hypothetical protein
MRLKMLTVVFVAVMSWTGMAGAARQACPNGETVCLASGAAPVPGVYRFAAPGSPTESLTGNLRVGKTAAGYVIRNFRARLGEQPGCSLDGQLASIEGVDPLVKTSKTSFFGPGKAETLFTWQPSRLSVEVKVGGQAYPGQLSASFLNLPGSGGRPNVEGHLKVRGSAEAVCNGYFGWLASTATPKARQLSALTTPDATSEQECITDALAPMRVTKPELRRPRNDNPETQIASANALAQRMPFNCLSDFNIQRHVRFEYKVGGTPFLYDTLSIDEGPYYFRGQASQLLRMPLPEGWNPPAKSQYEFGIYECTPGPGTTEVKLLTEEVAVDSQTNAVKAKKQFPVIPVNKIVPMPC